MEEKQAAAATASNVDEPIETSALEAEHGKVDEVEAKAAQVKEPTEGAIWEIARNSERYVD